jgi:DNA primase
MCEDAVSSLVVARTSDAMPLLGTHVAKSKLIDLRASGYSELVVWLDSDKYREARNIADQAKLIGFKARAEFTELDPKDLTDEIIKEKLKWTLSK